MKYTYQRRRLNTTELQNRGTCYRGARFETELVEKLSTFVCMSQGTYLKTGVNFSTSLHIQPANSASLMYFAMQVQEINNAINLIFTLNTASQLTQFWNNYPFGQTQPPPQSVTI